MDRVQRSEETYRKLCGDRPAPMAATNPEMQDILNRFIFGEVFYQGSLDEQHRELITIVVLAASQCLPQLRSHVGVGLRVGLAPEAIQEALYQCAPYIGFPKPLSALACINQVAGS